MPNRGVGGESRALTPRNSERALTPRKENTGSCTLFSFHELYSAPKNRGAQDLGRTWGRPTNPAQQAGLPASPGPHSVYTCWAAMLVPLGGWRQ